MLPPYNTIDSSDVPRVEKIGYSWSKTPKAVPTSFVPKNFYIEINRAAESAT